MLFRKFELKRENGKEERFWWQKKKKKETKPKIKIGPVRRESTAKVANSWHA